MPNSERPNAIRLSQNRIACRAEGGAVRSARPIRSPLDVAPSARPVLLRSTGSVFKLIAYFRRRLQRAAGRQLKAGMGSGINRREFAGRDAVENVHHDQVLVDEDGVNSVLHPEHVNAVARYEKQPVPGRQIGRSQQSFCASEKRFGNRRFVGNAGAARLILEVIEGSGQFLK